jgi:hypothetical protein
MSEIETIVDTSTPSVSPDDALPGSSAPEHEPEAPKAPEPTLQEKIQARADKIASERTSKGAKNTQKAAEKATLAPKIEEPAITPKVGEKDQKVGDTAPKLVDPAAPAASAFVPNFKLNIQKQDFEVPEILKPLMKDEASQKEIRELCEKAFGLDFAKPRHEATRQQNEVLTGELGAVRQQIQEVRQLYARGDFDGFFRRLNIPEEKVLQWMADKIQYNQLPAEQRAILDARRDAEARAYQAEDQVGTLQQQHEQLLTQQVQLALESTLARADVKTVADAFDARQGRPGAFKEEINRRGDYAWRTRNELVPPEKLVQELMSLLGPIAPAAPAPTTTVEPAAPAAAAIAPAKTPVIPNISGRSTSALPSRVKSIADIKRLGDEMSRQ